MRPVQQLIFDGKRLFCPKHPERELDKGFSSTAQGPARFSVFCTAPLAPAGNCMNSAEWPSHEDMLRELEQEQL